MTRSSTPKQAMSRPEPGTTMPPATCSVNTVQSKELSTCYTKQLDIHTKVTISKIAGLIGLRGQRLCERREIANIVPAYAKRCPEIPAIAWNQEAYRR